MNLSPHREPPSYNAYLATDTGYQALGGMTRRMNAEENFFEFEASYCDKYSVHVTVPKYGIDTEVLLTDEYFLSVAEVQHMQSKKLLSCPNPHPPHRFPTEKI